MAGLDVLRFVAIVLVIFRHIKPPPADLGEPWSGILSVLLRGGWTGVDLFFVLSGFLVSGLLFNDFRTRHRIGVGRFYVRRGLKIYPPFFALMVFSVYFLQARDGVVMLRSVLVELLFLQSYLPGLWFHTWSLAVEEHFYLLLPLVLLAIAKLNGRSATPLRPILALAAIVVIASPGLRIANWHHYAGTPRLFHPTYSFPTHLRLDGLFLGTAISYGFHFHHAWFVRMFAPWRRWLIAVGIASFIPAFVFTIERTPFLFTGGFSLLALGSGMLLIATLMRTSGASGATRAIAWLGAKSYSIYLWHLAVLLLLNHFAIGDTYAIRLALYVAGTFAVGILMSWLVETPVIWLRDRLIPARGQVAIEAAPVTS